tara:strand:+ start:1897 stop:2475 length:579 start_codon:yes stop_codon:yes gene_type:complete
MKIALCFFMISGVTPSTLAADRLHNAHQHGVSKLNLMIEGKRLKIELQSPGSDIVGFEHAAASKADRSSINYAANLLKDNGKLFDLSIAAGCRLASSEVEVPGGQEKYKHHNRRHGHGEKSHYHHNERIEGEEHSEFHARYLFTCKQPEKLTRIDIKYFDIFPLAEKIDVRVVTPRIQFRTELTAGKSRLTL